MKWGMRDMPSRTSWFNKEIVAQSLRNTGWVGIVYLFGLVFAIPLRILMDYTRPDGSYNQTYLNLFSIQLEIQVFLMFGIPILLAIFLFRYMQVKNASDFMHSLPIKRSSIYNHYVSMGIILLVLPILIVGLILFIMHSTMNIEYYFTPVELREWLLTTVIVAVFIFFTTVFAGMLTGISAMQGIFSLILLIFPLAISILTAFNLSFLLKGFPHNYYIDSQFQKYSPITIVDRLINDKMGSTELVIYLILSAVLYVLALQIYKIRKTEMVSQAVGFPQLKPVFIYGVTFCMMLFGGLYFGETQKSSFWIVFGYIVGSLIGYLIAQMIVEKTWRVFTKIKGYTVYVVTIAALFFLFQFDVTDYEKRVPEVQDIKGVYVGDGYYDFKEIEDPVFINDQKKLYSDPENIGAVNALHKQLIQESETNGAKDQVFILYELKDGSRLTREYKIPSKKQYSSYLKPVYESLEYKEANYPLLTVDPTKVDRIRFSASGPVSKNLSVSDPTEISQILEALKEDIQNETFEEVTTDRASLSYVELALDNNKRINLDFKSGYDELSDLLESKKKLKDVVVTPDDIEYAVVFKDVEVKRDPQMQEVDEGWVKEMIQEGKAIKVTEKDNLEDALRNFSYGERGEYLIAFYYKDHPYTEVHTFAEQLVPSFIKEHFE
jgi:ABC-2 type transport system permease protein